MMTYRAVVIFGTERQMIETKRRYTKESDALLAAEMKRIKKSYKGITGDALNVYQVGETNHDMEIINMNMNNAVRTAYFTAKAVFEIDDNAVVDSTTTIFKDT